MGRTSALIKRVKIRLVLAADGERDESDHRRHAWVTTGRLGLLTARGRNTKAVADQLLAELLELAHSPGAQAALSKERARSHSIYLRESKDLGVGPALERHRIRMRGGDPDAEVHRA